MLVLEGLIGFHSPVQLQLLQITGGGIGLDYRGIEWFALETNRDHSVIFDCIQVLHFRLLLTMMATPFLLRDPCPQ